MRHEGPGVLHTEGEAFRCEVAAVVRAVGRGWQARVMPLNGDDLMNLEIGLETMPGPWFFAFDGDEPFPVTVTPDGDKSYLVTRLTPDGS